MLRDAPSATLFKDWRGSSGQTKSPLTGALALLILSTVIVGYGNYLGAAATL